MILQLTRATKALLLSCIAVFFMATSYAQTTTTYTAVANGNYTSASTWQGGIKPPVVLGDVINVIDHVIIPTGITVTLDTNLISDATLKSGIATGIIECDGTLTGQPGKWILSRAVMRGKATGIINIDSMDITSADFNYKGTINVGSLYMREYGTAYSGETYNVSKKVIFSYSNNIYIRGTMNILNHCTIVKQAKVGFYTPGNFNILDTVNIVYNYQWGGVFPNGDRMLDSNWMAKKIDTLTIATHDKYASPGKPYACRVMKDMNFNGTMIIKSGALRLNGHKLTLGPNAKVFCSPDSGWILGDPQASIEIKATNDIGNGLLFYPGDVIYNSSDTLKDLTINMGNATGSAKLLGDLYIANKLDLQKGRLHLVDTTSLMINNGATITNASTNSCITNDFGTATHINVGVGSTTTFPVGTMSAYAPVDVKNNSSNSEVYKVGARAGVLDTATKGFDIATQEPCVAATWWVNPSATTGSSADVTLKWPAALEVNSFDRSQSFITTYLYNQTKWDTQTTTSAATQSGSFYTHTETVNNFSTTNSNYFSVFDGMTSLQYLSINNVSLNGKVTLYPNPTSGNTTIGMTLEHRQTIAVQLTDVSGRVVYTKAATPYTSGKHSILLPTEVLTNGLYFVQLTNEQGTLLNSGKLIKQ